MRDRRTCPARGGGGGGGGRGGVASQSSCERRTQEASVRVCVERRSRRCAASTRLGYVRRQLQ